MNDPIRRNDIRHRDRGIIDHNAPVFHHFDREGISVERWDISTRYGGGGDVARHDVILKNVDEFVLVFVFEELGDGAFRECIEGIVGWGKESERTISREHLNQVSRCHGSNKSRKVITRYSNVNNSRCHGSRNQHAIDTMNHAIVRHHIRHDNGIIIHANGIEVDGNLLAIESFHHGSIGRESARHDCGSERVVHEQISQLGEPHWL
mmetsp:Transcript_6687/g.12872  ORF Transcript_6687/g.12872 Transcript_6687/m.12872 type:complete len:207 (+) Transcript_6687:294-914(+)